jgi:hypothetical protein
MGIGNPITLTGNVSSKTISVTATGGQTLFSVTGGYRINQVSVYRNGTRLVDALDYTARDGSTVTLLSPATGGDILEFQVFDDFRVADALNVNSGGVVNGSVSIVSAATTALLVDGNARVTGILTVGTSSITLDGANNQILVGTGVTISSSGVIGSSELPAGSVGSPSLFFTGDANTGIYSPGADQVAVATNGAQRITVDASGRLLVGTSSARNNLNDSTIETKIQIEGAGDNDSAALTIISNSGTTNSDKRTGLLVLGRTRGTAVGSNTPVVQDDAVGMIEFKGNDGTSFTTAATIKAQVDGSIGTDDMPGRLVFSTTADGAALPTERMRINNSGNVGINETSPDRRLHVRADGVYALKVGGQSGAEFYLELGQPTASASPAINYTGPTASLRFLNNGVDVARFDSSGRLLVGTSSAAATYVSLGLQGNGSVATNQATLAMARGSNPSGDTQELGRIEFFNNNSNSGGAIIALSDGAWTSGSSHPTRLEFSTTADGASSPTERMRITSAGFMGLGTSSVSRLLHVAQANSTAYSSSDFEQDYQILRLNNTTNDGSVGLEFQVGTNGQASITANEVTDGQTDICFGTRGSGARTEKVRITSAGLVGIGVTSPQSPLDVTGSGNIGALSDLALRVYSANRSAFLDVGFDGLNASTNSSGLKFFLNNTERARIDSSGRLLIGTSSTNGSFNSAIQIAGSGVAGTQLISRFDNNAGAPNFYFAKSRGASVNTNTLVQSGDEVGVIGFYAADGTNYVPAAQIRADIDGTPGTNDMPGRLVFATTADGASGPTERMRITSGGLLKVTTGTQHSRYTNAIDHAIIQDKDNWLLACVNTYNSGPNGILITYSAQDPNNTSSSFLYCEGTTTLRAQIRSNGGLVNYQANDVNLSDRNVKKDISPAADTWDCIKEWEIVNYRYKDQPDDADLNLGVIAQQVAESCPEVITVFEEAKDDQPEKLGVKEQQMYWMAIKALQEAQVRIETLEAEVAALKAS